MLAWRKSEEKVGPNLGNHRCRSRESEVLPVGNW